MENVVICGKGRIGNKVFEQLSNSGCLVQSCYLDKEQGLVESESIGASKIDMLIICISPAKEKHQWAWNDIFNGLETQVNSKTIEIENIVFVSSTRVYDGINKGFITDKTSALSNTDKGKALLAAELKLMKLANNVSIIRCAGLIGNGYRKYEEILQTTKLDKTRFAVGISEVTSAVIESFNRVKENKLETSVVLRTNSNVYYKGEVYNLESDSITVEALAKHFPILIPTK